uniref:RING-type domain-containing protein n=1 Tax=Compsopogon caeruleus TaxID=31354 RepID=A0A7S1TEV2_9RHOD
MRSDDISDLLRRCRWRNDVPEDVDRVPGDCCSICLEDLDRVEHEVECHQETPRDDFYQGTGSEGVVVLPRCLHAFHTKCVRRYLRSGTRHTCPLCQNDIAASYREEVAEQLGARLKQGIPSDAICPPPISGDASAEEELPESLICRADSDVSDGTPDGHEEDERPRMGTRSSSKEGNAVDTS